jgi:hypothetical protein
MQVPHIFSPGFPSKANEVNENFAALADAINGLDARLTALDGGGTLPFAGNYFLMGFQTGLIPAGGQAIIEGIVYTGDVTLHAGATPGGGALTMTVREAKNELHVSATGSSRAFVDVTETTEAQWVVESTGLVLVVPADVGAPRRLRFARGATRLFIGNHLNAIDGSSVMLFLIRKSA